LEESRLRPDDLNGFGDIDLDDLRMRFQGVGIPLRARITSAPLERTIEGASTLTINVVDDDLSFLRSGSLRKGAEIEIDGLFFRLCGIKKNGRQLSIIFEEREINLLRQRKYSKPKVALRSQVTRAEFVAMLLREVTETRIRYVIPELHKVQEIDTSGDLNGAGTGGGGPGGGYGFPPHAWGPPFDHHHPTETKGNRGLGLTVKGAYITKRQCTMADAILSTGVSVGARRKCLVASIMTSIQESTLTNLSGGDLDSVGLFQQRNSWGSFRDRHDPVTAARLFFKGTHTGIKGCIYADQQEPDLSFAGLCQKVQNSAYPDAYAKWRDEAEKIVTAWGLPGGQNESDMSSANSANSADQQPGVYHYYRGIPPKKGHPKWGRENSWTCITRLAQQVNWRAFEVAGAIYFIDEEYLFKSRAKMIIQEEDTGIDSIDFDYDENKPQGQVTVQCEIKRWAAPPGSIIKILNHGPVTGRWLVASVTRDLFSTSAEVTLKKPRPALPEPEQDDVNQQVGFGGKTGGDEKFQVGTGLVKPIPHPYFTHQGGRHNTDGLAGYPAIDFFAAPGSPVIAPESGRIERFSGHDPAEGPPLGVGGPLGWSIYLRGNSGTTYFMTHLGTRTVKVGQVVGEADKIGTVADYDKYAGKGFSHCHCGVHGGKYTIEDLGNSPAAVKK
jgi:murein DD-endopeptidase MepM/ murein hydrolase activator NlpD